MSDAVRIEDDEDFPEDRRYTYADYLEWEGSERYELIDGKVFQMASPSVAHQAILGDLFNQFYNWLREKPCQVFAAPLDVRLFPQEDKSDKTVVQPDLLVVCDKDKLSKGSVDGPPDLVVEIVSPSNSHPELFLKFHYYMKAGVREYWVIDSEEKKALVHIYENGHYFSSLYENNDHISVTVLPGLDIALEDLWARIPSE
jgi:Uma2 family endonuclease